MKPSEYTGLMRRRWIARMAAVVAALAGAGHSAAEDTPMKTYRNPILDIQSGGGADPAHDSL